MGRLKWLSAVFAVMLVGCQKPAAIDTVHIASTPEGAMIFIDNKYVGLTPHTVRGLAPGAHSLKLQKNGYKTHLATFDPASRRGKIAVKLESLAVGKLVITSVPSDARVTLDGRYVGNTPLTISNLMPREYQVRVTAEDYEAWLQNIHVKDDKPIEVKAVLTSRYEKYFQGAIAAAPDEIFNFIELARHYLNRKDFAGAIELYKKAMALAQGPNADRQGAQRLISELAKAYSGWFTDSDEEDLKKLRPMILGLFSKDGDLAAFFRQVRSWDMQARGGIFMRPDKPNLETIKLLEETIKANPKNMEMRLALGQLYMSERQYDKAQATYEEALKVDPKNFAAHRQLSDLYRRVGKYEEAQRELELAAECCDDPVWKPELYEKLASLYHAKGKYADAVAQWKKAIAATQDPEDACRRRLRLALLYQKMGEKTEALKLYQEIVDTSQNPGLRNYAQYFLKRAQR